jgi:hypothetical protein
MSPILNDAPKARGSRGIELLPVQQETDVRAPARQIAKAIAEIAAWSRPDYDPENQLSPVFPEATRIAISYLDGLKVFGALEAELGRNTPPQRRAPFRGQRRGSKSTARIV